MRRDDARTRRTAACFAAAMVAFRARAVWCDRPGSADRRRRWRLRPSAIPRTVVRFPVTLPDDQQITSLFYEVVAISPDGTQLVYAANGRLYVRSMTELEARPIAGTEAG